MAAGTEGNRKRRLGWWAWVLGVGIVAGAVWGAVRARQMPPPPRARAVTGPTAEQQREVEAQAAARPDDPLAQLQLGNLYVDLGRMREALPPLEKAAGHPRTAAAAGLLLARVGEKGPHERVIPAAQMAVAAAPKDARSWEGLVRVLYSQGKPELAVAALNEAIRLFPEAQRLRFIQAETLEQDGLNLQAAKVYQKALAKLPDANAQLMLALILARSHAIPEAKRAFQKALELDPGAVPARLGLVKANLDLGLLNEAEQSAYAALQVAPEDPEAMFLLAQVLRQKGDPESQRSSRELLDRVLTLRPEHVDARYAVGQMKLLARDGKGAVREFEEALASQPHRNEIRRSYAEALRLAGEPKRAAQEQALAGQLAEVEQRKNELEQRVDQSPRSAAARCDLADFYLENGAVPLAIKEYERARALEPNNRRAAAGLVKATPTLAR